MIGIESGGGVGEEVEDVAGLLAAGFEDGQQGFEEAAAFRALGAEAEFAGDHGGTQGSFAGVVGRFDAVVIEERPQPAAMLEEFLAGACGLRVTTAQTTPQQSFDLGAHRGQRAFQAGPFPIGARELFLAEAVPVLEQQLGLLQQVSPELLCGGRAGVDQ